MARTVTGLLRAVKVVRREDFEMEKTFEREFQGIQHYEKVSQDHKGLVDVLHVGRDPEADFYYYVMELADDENGDYEDLNIETYRPRTLSSDLRRNPARKIEECINLGVSMASALGHLHQAGLTHRDVKPSNIIFVKGQPRLADIGLVARDGQRTYVGTEGYVPPEGPGSTSADLYSLAMVLYEMHTGKDRLDFPELPTNMELPPTVNRDEWRAMNSVICRAGSPDPRKRFETAHAFAAALHRILGGNDNQYREKKKRSTFSKLVISATVLILLAAISGGGFWLWKDREHFRGDNSASLVQNDGLDNRFDIVVPDPPASPDKDAKPAETPINGEDKPKKEPRGFSLIDRNDADSMLNDGGIVITDSNYSPVVKEEPKPDKPVPRPVRRASLKIFSYPSGATVWLDEKEIGRTPTGFLEFDLGPVQLTLKLAGYHDHFLLKNLNEGRQSEQIPLIPDLRPVPGPGNWINKADVSFRADAEGVFVSENPISLGVFEQYLLETKRNVPAVVLGDAVQIKEEQAVWDFCDWMTAKDRKFGYLDRSTYYAPRRDPVNMKNDTFSCALENRFGTLVLNSEPPGADLYNGDLFLGKTPITLNSIRYGSFQIKVSLSGYQSELAEGFITGPEAVPMTVPLKRDASVVYGQKWQNGQGMNLVPVGELMVAIYETRVQDYQHFVAEKGGGIYPPRPGFEQGPMHPVAGVSGADALSFCKWLTERERTMNLISPEFEYRLPTDLEWSQFAGLNDEKGDTPEERDSEIRGHFPWGVKWPPPSNSGNFADISASEQFGKYIISGYQDGFSKTAPVGSFKENSNGIYDLSGNVWEWVQDRYSGPTSPLRVVRGGGWNSFERDVLLSSYRNAVPSDMREGLYGFRYVLAKVKPKN